MKLALFDFDGTITTRDMLPDFVRAAVPPERFRRGFLRLAPWIVGYKIGWVSGVPVRSRIAEYGFRGMSESDYRDAGERFAREALPQVLRPEAMQRVAWHKANGDRVVVVSGSFDVYLAPWCRAHGVELICSSLESIDGTLTGRYAGRQCVRDEKARRVREQCDLDAFDAVYAYGDTREDFDLLSLADFAWYRGAPWSGAPRSRQPSDVNHSSSEPSFTPSKRNVER
jgi:phosphatidylglycerophosphatase C